MDNEIKNLWIVRHTSVDVPAGVCYGATDVGLKPTFCAEAEVVASHLVDYTPDVVFTSPLSRAIKLAGASGYRDATIDKRLREQSFGDWEMQRYDDITDPQIKVWYEEYVHTIPTNGESFAQVVARVGDFIEEMRSSGYHNILVFAHAGIQMATGAYLGRYQMIDAPKYIEDYGSVIKYNI